MYLLFELGSIDEYACYAKRTSVALLCSLYVFFAVFSFEYSMTFDLEDSFYVLFFACPVCDALCVSKKRHAGVNVAYEVSDTTTNDHWQNLFDWTLRPNVRSADASKNNVPLCAAEPTVLFVKSVFFDCTF